MPYPRGHKAKTRERIVERARLLFNKHGFASVSIDEIMAEVGLTRGGFYNHFSTKEELYGEAITRSCLPKPSNAGRSINPPDLHSPASSSPPTFRKRISTAP